MLQKLLASEPWISAEQRGGELLRDANLSIEKSRILEISTRQGALGAERHNDTSNDYSSLLPLASRNGRGFAEFPTRLVAQSSFKFAAAKVRRKLLGSLHK